MNTPQVRQQLEQLRARVDGQPLRQRVLLLLAVLSVLYFVADLTLFSRLAQRHQHLRQSIASLQQEIARCEQQTQEALRAQNNDPNAELRRQQQALATQIGVLDTQIRNAVGGLIEPQQMAQVLEQVIRRQSGLSLKSIESLDTQPLLDRPETDPAYRPGIWRHSVRVEFEGDFLSTLAYLRELQALPWRLHWDAVDITMKKYPQARVVVVVYTLSLREGWIGV